jgi:hypothetical protein
MQISIFGYKIEMELLILIVVLYLVIVVQTASSCTNKSELLEGLETMKNKVSKEPFTGANTNDGQSSLYSLNNYHAVDTSKWSQPNLTYQEGKPMNEDVKKFFARPQQQLPLKDGEMDFFQNVPFSPKCCPSTFSSSMGCACLTTNDVNYLNSRGMNNVPYSEY